MWKQQMSWGAVVITALFLTGSAVAQDTNDGQITRARLDALVRMMEQQQREIAELRARVADDSQKTMSETERKLLAEMIREEVAKADALRSGLPKWLEGLQFSGDIRVRYEGQFFGGKDGGRSASPLDRNRARFRLRFGFSRQIDEEWAWAFRLSTGNTTDPWEYNQTMTGDFTRKPVLIDQAYIQYRPLWAKKRLTIRAGKFSNPFVTTDMLWDPDIMPEGFSQQYVHKFGENELFVNLAQLFLQERANNFHGLDVTLLAYQVGMRYKLSPRTAWTIAAAYYQYINVHTDSQLAGLRRPSNSTETGVVAGESGRFFSHLGKQDFQLLDLYTDLTYLVGEKKRPLKLFGQATVNLANNAPSPYSNEHFAFIAGLTFGEVKKKGDWQAGYDYRYMQANAMPSGFTSSAFGSTNRQGHHLFFRYGLHDNVSATMRYTFSDWLIDVGEPARHLLRAELEIKF